MTQTDSMSVFLDTPVQPHTGVACLRPAHCGASTLYGDTSRKKKQKETKTFAVLTRAVHTCEGTDVSCAALTDNACFALLRKACPQDKALKCLTRGSRAAPGIPLYSEGSFMASPSRRGRTSPHRKKTIFMDFTKPVFAHESVR